jgi:hypothetical protein
MSDRPFGQRDAAQWNGQCDSGDPPGASTLTGLIRTIEGEIVPRLLMSVTAPMLHDGVARAAPNPEDVAELSRLLLARDSTLSAAFVQIFMQRGLARAQICRELLAPAAGHLGKRWTQAECDFGELSMGLRRLHRLLLELMRART